MLKFFLVYLKRYQIRFWLGALTLIIVDVLDVAWPLIIKYAIDNIAAPNVWQILVWCAVGYVGVNALQGIGRYWFRIFFHSTSLKIAQDLRDELFTHLQKLSCGFFNASKTGDLMSRATNDIEAVRSFYGLGIFIGVDIIAYFVTVPFIMLFLSVKLTLLSVILVPLLPFFVNRMRNLIHKRFKEVQETMSTMSNLAQENFAGIRVVKSFAQEENQIKDFDDINRKYVKQNLSIVKLDAILNHTLGLASALGIIIVVFIGGLETINGKISIGTFVAFPFYLGRLTWPMAALGWTVSVFQRAFASMERLQELFNTKPEIISPEPDKTISLAKVEGEIEFRNVSLSYAEPSHPALENINLKIRAGTTVAVMGPIGSGKSSLVNLIPRLFDPTIGEVTIDRVNIKKLSLTGLRNTIGFVPQDVFLFSESIKENIAFGITAPDDKSILKAAEIARVHNDIEGFTNKYDTMLGERGINLSGGQKQRITIARAIIKNPKILILDDCLSSVDVDTEESILRQLKDVLKNRTTIIVSHRLPAVKLADVIVFMENGKIVEYGKHSELLHLKGRYAHYYHRQKLISDLEKT